LELVLVAPPRPSAAVAFVMAFVLVLSAVEI
jgi:hypothetical protein